MINSIRNKDEYWYFRFTERFIFSKEMKDMKRVPMYGDKFIVIFLEMCAVAIQDQGWIKVAKYSSEEPYTGVIAKYIGEDPETVAHALSYYIKNGLVEVYSDEQYTALHVQVVENNMGRSSASADRKRLERRNSFLLKSESQALQNQETDTGKEAYGPNGNIHLTSEEYKDLVNREGTEKLEKVIRRLSAYKELGYEKAECESDYQTIIRYLNTKVIE